MSPARRWAGGLAIAAAFLWSAWSTEVSLGRLVEGVPFMLDFVGRMLPPDLRVLGQALRGALQTLQIAVVGTGVGAVLALPAAIVLVVLALGVGAVAALAAANVNRPKGQIHGPERSWEIRTSDQLWKAAEEH